MFAAFVLIVAALAAPAPQERQSRTPRTDETVAVAKGARLTVDNFAGEVVIKAWDRDSLRVQAMHNSRTKVNIRTTPSGVVVRAQHEQAPTSVDYEISVPAWMPVRVVGTYNFINVEGTQSEVSAETTRGDVTVRGGTGVTAKSIEGEVVVDGARGRIVASSVNEAVRITAASGEITVETTNGDITFTQMKAQNVEGSTVNGDILFEGAPADRGRYTFTTHNGDITIAIPESSNVSFSVRSYQGRFSPTINVSGPPRSEVRQGRRSTYTLGNGSAEMELETFGGNIRVIPPSALKLKEKRH
jgi:hypothetical protein